MSEGFKVSSDRSFFKIRLYYFIAYLTCQYTPGYLGIDNDRLTYQVRDIPAKRILVRSL